MDSYLKLIQSAPVPVIMIVSGIYFLLPAITGGISGKINVVKGRQRFSVAIGFLILLVGFVLYQTRGENVPGPADNSASEETLFNAQASPNSEIAPGGARNANLPYFMTRSIMEQDIKGKSAQELEIMRNEIFARHGMIFTSPDLSSYFSRQRWYVPKYEPGHFPAGLLNIIEQDNIQFLKHQESLRR